MGADDSLQLGRYQLVRKLATGGMAEVFLAKAMGPGGFEKSLVIKRILPNLARDPEFVEMFLHEARLAAQLNHPNVVQIFDFGEVDGTYYLAMEYVDGPNLRSILRRAPGRRMPVALGAKLIAQACEGLAYAHEFADPVTGQPLGLIHRDVSADNLLVARNGTVKVVDFGVAKVEGQATKDEPGVVKGKIAYMPPEQIAGDADLRADVYALGVILYELASGARPYEEATDNELMAAIVQRDPVPLMTRVPDVPVGYAMVVGKAMARNPDARFSSCRELQAALEDFLHSAGERVGSVHLAQFVASVISGPTSGTYPRVGTSPGTGSGTPVSGPSGVRPATGVLPALSPPATGRTSVPKTGKSTVAPSIAPVSPPLVPPVAPVTPAQGAAAARPKTGAFPSVPAPHLSPGRPASTGVQPAVGARNAGAPPAEVPSPRLTPGRALPTGVQPAVGARSAGAPPADVPSPRLTPGRTLPTGVQPAVEAASAPVPLGAEDDDGGMKVTITSRHGALVLTAPVVDTPRPVDPLAATTPGRRSPIPPEARPLPPLPPDPLVTTAPRWPSPIPPEARPSPPSAGLTTSPGWPAPVPPAGRPSPLPAPPVASRPSQSPLPVASRPSRPPQPVASGPSQPPLASSPSRAPASGSARTGTWAAFTPASSSIAALSSDVFAAPPSPDEWELEVPTGVGSRPALPPAPPSLTPGSPEARAAQVLSEGEALRGYEPGAPLVSDDRVRAELERDETINLFVRFATHGARLMPVHSHAPAMVQERVVGAVEGLVTAEAWGPLARLLERLEAAAPADANSTWVWTQAKGAFATPEQAQRVLERLRELAPDEPEAFGRCLRFFGPEFIPLFLEALEQLELAGSREALLHGLAELARLKQEPFVARVVDERPRRLADFVWVLEKGRADDRQRAFRQVLGRRDPALRREVLTGMARTGSDDAFNLVSQALGDREEAVRVHALELLAKHFPDRAFRLAEGLLAPEGYEARSPAERQATWRAVGSSTQPEAYYCIADVLKQKPALLQRARVQQLKLDALEGLAVMRTTQGRELLRAVVEDGSQPGAVVDAARRLAAAPPMSEPRSVAMDRRWDRISGTPRAFLRDLSALAQAARLVDVAAPALDVPFRRLRAHLGALLQRAGTVTFSAGNKQVLLNGAPVQDGDADAAMAHLALMCARYQVGGFTVATLVSDGELRELVRWFAEGPCAAGVNTPNIQRQVLGAAPPPRPVTPTPAFADPSREAMTRYVDLIVALKEFLAVQRDNPALRPGDAQRTLDELAFAMQTRAVRFMGLTPRSVGRDSVAFHHANVTVLSLGFAAELGVPIARLRELAEVAFFHDVGMYELSEDTLTRSGELTSADKDAMLAGRRASAWFPFERLGADRRAVAWASAIVEHGLDWGAKDEAGRVVQRAEIGVVGGILSLAKTYDALTSRRSFRAAMSPEVAVEVMTTKVSHRFRPDLLPAFAAFVKRHRARALGG